MQFPKDSFPHKSIIEWWYFNGHLFDKNKNEYAFMNCLFKTNPRKTAIPIVENIPAKEVYFSHSLFSNVTGKKHIVRTSPISILSKDSLKQKNLFINYLNPSLIGYVNNEIDEIGKFKYKIKNDNVDLVLTAKKRPFLHQGKGYFVIEGKKIYYYSLTNMDAKGTVNLDGRIVSVRGKAWMDHEWTKFAGATKWDWFSIQLDNETELMIQEYNDCESVYAGINHGNQKVEFANDLTLIPKKIWKSPVTGAKYPILWKILVPSKKIELNVKAPLPNQEILLGSLNYWEGSVNVNGKMNGKEVNGKGFMELTGRKMSKSKMYVYDYQLKKEANFYLNIAKKEILYLFKHLFGK